MKKVFSHLTYAGSIPFALCAVFFSTNTKNLHLLGSVEKILSAYGLMILSFLAIAVLLWFGFLVLSFKMLVSMFVAAFVVLLIIDHRLFQMDLVSNHYFQTRCFVAAIVIISLIISGALS